MKKVFAILLTAAMLCSFACIGASAEDRAIDQALLEEALGYIAQVRDAINSGTFTIKWRSQSSGLDVWVYDRANDRKLYEFGKEFFGPFGGLAQLLLGSRIRAYMIGTKKYVSLPERSVHSDDLSGISLASFLGFYMERTLNCYVTENEVLSVTRDGNRITLSTPDRTFEFTDGAFTYYKKTESGLFIEHRIESFSPIADQSYFSTEGMREIKLGWLGFIL